MWADVDPRDSNGRQWTAERGRLLALAEALAALPLAPSLIINSGNGIQPIWLLTNPIEANPEYHNTAEALCARLEAVLGAKGTHNVDRLLRVPGTRNFPNAREARSWVEAKPRRGSCTRNGGATAGGISRIWWPGLRPSRLITLSGGVEPGATAPRAQPYRQARPAGKSPEPLDFERLKELRARATLTSSISAGYNGDRARGDLALASLARRMGWGPVDAWRLIIAVRGDRKATRRDYVERTLQKAYAEQADTDHATADAKGDALFDLWHDGLALDIGRRWQAEARHVALWGRWMFWSGARWEPDERLIHLTRTRGYLRARADARAGCA